MDTLATITFEMSNNTRVVFEVKEDLEKTIEMMNNFLNNPSMDFLTINTSHKSISIHRKYIVTINKS